MVKGYRTKIFVNELKFSCISAAKACRLKLAITAVLVLICMGVGVFVAIKTNRSYGLCNLKEISLDNFYTGFTASASAFGARCISLTINVAILTGLAFMPALFPLSCALFAYRAYLLGLNFTLIFVFYGLGSIFTAVLIILPCQLATLGALVLFYCLFDRINQNCRRFGRCDCPKWLIVLAGLLIVLAINLAETLLLVVLNGKVILVI